MSDRNIAMMANVGSGTTVAGSGTALWGWATSSEFGVAVGAIGVVLGIFLQWHYKSREDARRQARHDAYMRKAEQLTSPAELAELGLDDD